MAEETQAETTETQTTEAETEASASAQPQATGTQPGKQAGPAQTTQERAFTQADVDRIVKERIEREKAKGEAAAQKARQAAEAQALAEQGKFKELSESQGKRIAELEATADELKAAQGQLKKYQQALSEYRDAQYAGIPDHIKALLEGRDILDQMAWLTANQEKLKPAAPPAEVKPPDINATQRGVPAGRQTDEQRREIAARLGVRPEFLPK